ncbi:hypothetical protein HN903_00760 [archaeon]|nr:hypothetical protein [archaeon]MBT7128262.1 hypothetical protein [archaeon]
MSFAYTGYIQRQVKNFHTYLEDQQNQDRNLELYGSLLLQNKIQQAETLKKSTNLQIPETVLTKIIKLRPSLEQQILNNSIQTN